MYQPSFVPATNRLSSWRWYEPARGLLHLAVVLGLIICLGISHFAEAYFTRGVATGDVYAPIPWTDVNPMGINTFLNEEADPAAVERSLDMIAEGGFGYVRQVFGWYEIEPQPGTFVDAAGVSTWEKYDRIVDLANARGLRIIARLEKPPLWARANQPRPRIDGPPDSLQAYADFVEAVVNRYKGRIEFYQIWNEPNLSGEWGGGPIDPRAYVDLLEVGYRAVKRADPSAVVLLAGLAPTDQTGPDNLSDLLFLQQVYDFGGAEYFDIATVMVYGYGYSPFDRRVGFGRNNFSRPIQTRDVMVRNGDADTPIWAVEYGWVALPDDWAGDPSPWGRSVSDEEQAKYLVEGYLRSQQEWPWMGVMAVWAFRWVRPPDDPNEVDNPTRGFGIVEYDFTPRPSYDALARAAPALQRDFTGSYELSLDQQAILVSGGALELRIWGERLDLVVFGDGQLNIEVDGKPRRPKSVSTDDWTSVAAAADMPDGPHDIRVQVTAEPGRQPPAVAGYTVSRRPFQTWIYPWIVMALWIALALMFVSSIWAVRDLRRIRERRKRAAARAERASSGQTTHG